ncbi:hypothetical protein MUK42_27535 [Musa troglodytarum]|uniref:Uncharacterized protein n=1 Tax=Musa troglodytarum TaxID=320322 RepID=A0A9E7JWR1_9LILI|nr:hypothetical protein MUK42_27535 [Musa troglodytarum]
MGHPPERTAVPLRCAQRCERLRQSLLDVARDGGRQLGVKVEGETNLPEAYPRALRQSVSCDVDATSKINIQKS